MESIYKELGIGEQKLQELSDKYEEGKIRLPKKKSPEEYKNDITPEGVTNKKTSQKSLVHNL